MATLANSAQAAQANYMKEPANAVNRKFFFKSLGFFWCLKNRTDHKAKNQRFWF